MKDYHRNNSRKGGCIFSLIKLTILVAIVLATALYFCLGYVGDYAIKTITSGTEITGGIGNIKVKPIDESAEVIDFYITNPAKKYNKENAIAFKRAFVKVDINPVDVLSKKLIVVDEITIEGLEANIEYSENSVTSTNLHDIASIIEGKLGIKKDNTKSEKTTSTEEGEPLKFIIKKLSFKDGKASSSVLGNVAETILPDFEIENIGVEQGGKTASEIIVYVLPRIAAQATNQMLKGGWKATIKASGDTSDTIKNATKDTVNKLKSLFN